MFNVLVAAPVISIVLSPPWRVIVWGLIDRVSVVASPSVVFPSTDKSPDTVVVADVMLPAKIKLLT